MRRLSYTAAHNLGRLHGELVSAVPALAPTTLPDGRQEARVLVSGSGTRIDLYVPDDLSSGDETTISSVIAAHDPTPTPVPTPADFGADIPTDFETTVATTVSNLRAYIALSAPTNAQSTAVVKLLARIALWQIRRVFG